MCACQIYAPGCSHLLTDHLGHHISGVDVDGADGHNFLPVTRCELANQHGDERVELGYLLPVVLLHGVVIAFLETGKSHVHIGSPPDLSAGQCNLDGDFKTLEESEERILSR